MSSRCVAIPATRDARAGDSTGGLAVQATNDESIAGKLSAASQGYFEDDYVQHFVAKPSRRAPLVNRGYYLRVWVRTRTCQRPTPRSCVAVLFPAVSA